MLTFDGQNILDLQVINLADFLAEGDVVVFNDARVIKAKLKAKILRNNAELEFNLDQENQGLWNALCRPAKKVQTGDILQIAPDFFAEIRQKNNDGTIILKFQCEKEELPQKLEKYGETPLPPYIKRGEKNFSDQQNYQTYYAKNGVAVAAPTAGLHFNEKLFAALDEKKIEKVFVTLNVGAGTFLPIRSDFIKDHKMHRESFFISQESADKINSAKKIGKKIIAIGTTSLRVLESCCDENGFVKAGDSTTEIFLYPPYKIRSTDILMTNFHLPKSTLFMLICAFIGSENAFKIYDHAIKNSYRFYSYGDASLLFKNN